MSNDDADDLQYVTDRIADANEATAKTVTQAAALTTARHPTLSLRNVHDELVDAYAETRRAIDRLEHTLDDRNDGTRATPRQIKSEHSERIHEQYDGPVAPIAEQLLARNRREWLHAKPETNGAQQVERHGLTNNQRSWLNQLQDAWDAYDGNSDE